MAVIKGTIPWESVLDTSTASLDIDQLGIAKDELQVCRNSE
jgi:hypothetical protein